jgi:hypothetical protein
VTPLPPIENRRVRGVASERYPLNKRCSQPECSEPAVDGHLCFPRSTIGNDSWFVAIEYEKEWEALGESGVGLMTETLPHVTGLCRAHHDDVEQHRAWIKLYDETFLWYDRVADSEMGDDWFELGPLNPQPGSQEGKPKRKKFRGEARRKRKTISLRVPDDAGEDGAGLLTDAIEQLEERISGEKARPPYYTLLDALSYALLNSGPEDF